jgi:hypothetical protein
MKRLILLFVCGLALAFTHTASAQCIGWSQSTSDGTCTSYHDCVSPTGCASLTFTAPCDGEYTLKSVVACAAEGCKNGEFNACVNVYENGQLVPGGNCHLNPCSECTRACENTVCLEAGHEYTLYVCLIDCTNQECDMPPWCTAYGYIYYSRECL